LKSLLYNACILEASARKPGNVHPEAAFEDLTFSDFVQSAEALSQVLPLACSKGVGWAVLESIRETQARLTRPTNPNLGIALLLAPLVTVPRNVSLTNGITAVLDGLTVEDARHVYEAIRLANPGGMGKVEQSDVSETPKISLREAMAVAADRDSIAAEYCSGFQIILGTAVPFLAARKDFQQDWENAVLQLQLLLMGRFPDTLIARKCGRKIAEESAARAAQVFELGGPETEPGRRALGQFDQWLRADGHRRNPGTTADLIAASLFAAGRDGMIKLEGYPNPSAVQFVER